VFDEGERQPRLAHKRVKVCHLLTVGVFVGGNADVDHVKPRRRKSQATRPRTCLTRNDGWCLWFCGAMALIPCICVHCRSSHNPPDPETSAPLRSAEKEVPPLPSAVAGTVNGSAVYAQGIKDPGEIKQALVPFGANASIPRDAVVGAQ
jgi:hypothetical protein